MTVRTTTPRTKKETKKVKTEGVIAIDNGGNNTKVFAEGMESPIHFSSRKGIGFYDEDYIAQSNDKDMVIEWNGDFYFTGEWLLDSPYELSGLEETKTTDFFILNLLVAVAKYGFNINRVITDVPFVRHKSKEINAIKEILIKNHEITINDVKHEFEIEDVEVVGEGVIACHAIETEGIVRWLDLGSRTVAYATSAANPKAPIPLKPLKNQSGTIEGEGLDIRDLTKRNQPTKTDYMNYVNHILPTLKRKKWQTEDYVIAFGGGALVQDLVESLQSKFPNLVVAEEALYVQVIAMLNFALSYIWIEEDDLDGEE